MRPAVQQAVVASGAKGLDMGGELFVTYTGDDEASRARADRAAAVCVTRYQAPDDGMTGSTA